MRTHIIALATTHALLENDTTSGSNTRSVWCACEILVATRSSCTVTQTICTRQIFRFSARSSVEAWCMQECAVIKLQMLDCHSPILFVKMLLVCRLMQARLQSVCLNQNQIHLVFTTPKHFRPYIQRHRFQCTYFAAVLLLLQVDIHSARHRRNSIECEMEANYES